MKIMIMTQSTRKEIENNDGGEGEIMTSLQIECLLIVMVMTTIIMMMG